MRLTFCVPPLTFCVYPLKGTTFSLLLFLPYLTSLSRILSSLASHSHFVYKMPADVSKRGVDDGNHRRVLSPAGEREL